MRMILPSLPAHCGLWEQSLQDNSLLSGPYLQIKHELITVEILIIQSDNAMYCKCNWGTEQHSITKLQYLIDPLVLCASWKKSRRYCSSIWQIWCRSCSHVSTRISFMLHTSFVASSTYPGQVRKATCISAPEIMYRKWYTWSICSVQHKLSIWYETRSVNVVDFM